MDERAEMNELMDRLCFLQDYGFQTEIHRYPDGDWDGYRAYKAKTMEGRLDGMVVQFECRVKNDDYEFLYWEDQYDTITYDTIWRFICFEALRERADLKYESRKKILRLESRIKELEPKAV